MGVIRGRQRSQRSLETETVAKTPEKEVMVRAIAPKKVDDLFGVEEAVTGNTVVILTVSTLAQRSPIELEASIDKLYEYVTTIGGDIARLGDERVLITPPGIRIWRSPLHAPSKTESA